MISRILRAYQAGGFLEICKRAIRLLKGILEDKYYALRFRNAPVYANPTQEELEKIESDLKACNVQLEDFFVDLHEYEMFKKAYPFPLDYHGGKESGVWEEKILEHYVAWRMLGIEHFQNEAIYVDVAAHQSPWARLLREREASGGGRIMSYAIDLNTSPSSYAQYPYYKKMDATNSDFNSDSVDGVSLQCAYEMFMGDSDVKLIHELKRILKSGKKAIISPLYMHTHACHYATPEFYGKGFGDEDSYEYIRHDCRGIYTSRKYDACKLKERILDVISGLGMKYKLYVLRNKEEISKEIYMHFILEIEK